jgi:hypothetical protein
VSLIGNSRMHDGGADGGEASRQSRGAQDSDDVQAARKLLTSGMTVREVVSAFGASVPNAHHHFPAALQKVITAERQIDAR